MPVRTVVDVRCAVYVLPLFDAMCVLCIVTYAIHTGTSTPTYNYPPVAIAKPLHAVTPTVRVPEMSEQVRRMFDV